jgi:hypothetical protein
MKRARTGTIACIAALFALAPAAAQAQTVSGWVNANWGSGNTTMEEDESDLANAAVQNVGPVQNLSPPGAPSPGGVTSQAAEAVVDLGQGVIAAAVGTDAQVLDFGPNRWGNARASLDYDETLTVVSAALSSGTPVTLRLRCRIAFGGDSLHSLAEVAGPTSSQYATSQLTLNVQFQDLEGENGSAYDVWFDSAGGLQQSDGLFADPAQPLELAVADVVGGTVRLVISVDAFASSQAVLASSGPSYLYPTAATGATAALVFGVESDPPGASLESPLLGTVLPGYTDVTAPYALAQVLPLTVGAPVTVPESSTLGSELAACAVLLATARRYAASHASA